MDSADREGRLSLWAGPSLKGGVTDTSRQLRGMSYRRDVEGSHAMNDTLRTLSLWDVWTAAHRAGVDFDGVRNFVHHQMS